MTVPEGVVVVRMDGKADQRYVTLGPRQARMLGLEVREGAEHELRLSTGADPNALLVLPSGSTFTALELTALRHKSGSTSKGWQIDVLDPCGYPPQD